MGVRSLVVGSKMSGERGQFLIPGEHRAVIETFKEIDTRVSQKAVAVELKILESSNPEVMVGSMYTVMWMIEKFPDAAPQALKRAIFNIVEATDESEINDELMAAIFDEGLLNGKVVNVHSYPIKTKSDKDFTVHEFSAAVQE